MRRLSFSLLLLAGLSYPCLAQSSVPPPPPGEAPDPAPARPSGGSWRLTGDLDLLTGQYFFKRSAGSVNGYFNADLQEARSFSPESGVFVTQHLLYSGFKQVNELAGGGTLFQQSFESSLGAKWIRRFEGGYSLKPRLEIASQLFRESKDEDWGKGLYDFWRYDAGLTWERKTRLGVSVPWTYQFSYDFYYSHYPRFKSLSSQYGAALSSPDPGTRLLDAWTHQLSWRNEFDLPDFASAWTLASVSMVEYPDQKVVNSKGEYLDTHRSDALTVLGGGWSKRLQDLESMGRVRPTVGMGLILTGLFSNQNNFDTDPNRLKYVDGYYDYWEARLSPSLNALFLTGQVNVRLGYDLGYRSYMGRLAQEADGTYLGRKLRQQTHGVSLEVTVPVWQQLDFKARGLWSYSGANTAYEQSYVYTYRSYNYFAGLSWKL